MFVDLQKKKKPTFFKAETRESEAAAPRLFIFFLDLSLSVSLCFSRMGSSASAPRQADASSKPLHAPKIVIEKAAALGSAASSSESSDDDDSGVVATGGVAAALASPSPIEPPPLDHPSPEALARMCSAVATLIEGVGEDSGREGLFDTPKVRLFCLKKERIALFLSSPIHLFLTRSPALFSVIFLIFNSVSPRHGSMPRQGTGRRSRGKSEVGENRQFEEN